MEASDVIIQVLDARDPIGCRCTDVEKMVLKSGAHKRVVLLLNKIGEEWPTSASWVRVYNLGFCSRV